MRSPISKPFNILIGIYIIENIYGNKQKYLTIQLLNKYENYSHRTSKHFIQTYDRF